MMRVLSLGAGVQSTTVALMVAAGELEPLDCAIFADTGAEPAAVYEHLDWLTSDNVLPFPVHRVSAGDLRQEILAAMRGEARMDARPPFYVANPDGSQGTLMRQCTEDYKLVPIARKLRELLGLKPRQHWPKEPVIEEWLGISTDEAARAKPSRRPAIERRFPLLDLGMSRWDCLQWLRRHDYPQPPKSACTFCPYHNDALWREMKTSDPVSFADAVRIDAAIRPGVSRINRRASSQAEGVASEWFVHRSMTGLAEVDLRNLEDRGQLNFFENECEGVCGV